ncbi:MAG TPA: hypothetical protein VJ577_16625 [Burkholderiaceae bacterium]|nr:hypothetical protein [Burkholderiaceae bacterium]
MQVRYQAALRPDKNEIIAERLIFFLVCSTPSRAIAPSNDIVRRYAVPVRQELPQLHQLLWKKGYGNSLPDWLNGPRGASDIGRNTAPLGHQNGLHSCMDVAFCKDVSAIHLRYAAANLGVVRKLAI